MCTINGMTFRAPPCIFNYMFNYLEKRSIGDLDEFILKHTFLYKYIFQTKFSIVFTLHCAVWRQQ